MEGDLKEKIININLQIEKVLSDYTAAQGDLDPGAIAKEKSVSTLVSNRDKFGKLHIRLGGIGASLTDLLASGGTNLSNADRDKIQVLKSDIQDSRERINDRYLRPIDVRLNELSEMSARRRDFLLLIVGWILGASTSMVYDYIKPDRTAQAVDSLGTKVDSIGRKIDSLYDLAPVVPDSAHVKVKTGK